MSTLRYIMYLRKSSEQEDRQAPSLPAQERELGDLVSRLGISALGEPIREATSARHPGRPLFGKVMQDLKEGRGDAIVCWHPDRLARNPLDGGEIMWALAQGIIKEIVTPGRIFKNTSDDKLLLAIVFGMATKYTDDLSANIRRGNRQAVTEGRWPSKPPLGYKRAFDPSTGNRRHMPLVPDSDRFDLVREMWRLRLADVPVLEILRRARDEWNLTTPITGKVGGKPLAVSHIYRMFRNPFYAGVMVYKGETHPGKHESIVTWREFEKVQAGISDIGGSLPKPKQHVYGYRGFLRCGRCKALLTAEQKIKKNGKRFLYYHCCRKNRRYGYCPEPSIEERDLEHQLRSFLGALALPDAISNFLVEIAGRLETTTREEIQRNEASLKQAIERCDARLRQLRSLCADGVIATSELAEDRERLLRDQRRMREELALLQKPKRLIEPLKQGIFFVNQAISAFDRGNASQRLRIIRAVSSNASLKGKKVLIEAKKLFSLFRDLKQFPELCTEEFIVRTFAEKGNDLFDDVDLIEIAHVLA